MEGGLLSQSIDLNHRVDTRAIHIPQSAYHTLEAARLATK